MQCPAARKVGDGNIDCRRNVCWLVALQGQGECDVTSTIARLVLTDLLIEGLEVRHCRGGYAADRLQVIHDPGINVNRRVRTRSVV